ncbi:glutaredoxin-like YruB-family protein [Melghiribacillus thermohalophilus]|uniref:Glutaredoxin-like YruB-family protein n=1 Tax=Melghiribacillus thermohalophilus TaxID=1324956 RepID=A0A4R3MUJ9_9BACI|nr:glutaredoxin domain-containing protein [Melghiribacillus thermohalophilus]TCT20014.1 glutaredoxin-like YruB-family protein [Melghiribacillus thermohalophilus]
MVTVYTTSTCPYCNMVKTFLEQKGVEYKEVNVERDPIAAQRLVQTTGEMGVPQTEINGKWVLGFDPQAITELLEENN